MRVFYEDGPLQGHEEEWPGDAVEGTVREVVVFEDPTGDVAPTLVASSLPAHRYVQRVLRYKLGTNRTAQFAGDR